MGVAAILLEWHSSRVHGESSYYLAQGLDYVTSISGEHEYGYGAVAELTYELSTHSTRTAGFVEICADCDGFE